MKASTVFKFFLTTSFVTFSSFAFSQDQSSEEAADDGLLEEVLVTASRRGDQDIMTTPVSITALQGDELEKYAMRDLNDVAVSVPGLSAGTVSAFKSAQFSMRGVTETTIILYKESPVAVTIDEFVVPHIQTSNLEMFDVEAIEVLRGPQGTLFGKNTTGGVIAVRTKQPVLTENSLDLQYQFGDFGTNKFNGAFNFGIGERLAFRFAGMYLKSDGYYINGAAYGPIGEAPFLPWNSTKHIGDAGTGDGRKMGGDDVFTGRAKMLWQPTDDLNLTLTYEYVRDEGDSPPIVHDSQPGYFLPFFGFQPAPATGQDPLKVAGSSLRCHAFVCIPQGHLVDIDGIYLRGDWHFSDNWTLYFNAGNREQESRLPSSYGGAAGPISVFDATRDDNRETSQFEARVGSNLDGNINFVTGIYLQDDDTEFCVAQLVGITDGFFVGTPPDYWNDNPRILCNSQEAEAQAIYIDGTWDVTDRLHITAGLRYTWEEKSWAGRPMTFTLDGQPLVDVLDEPLDGVDFNRFPEGVAYNDQDWSEPTYRLVFGYDFSDDLYGFAGYNRGFKSGGYNDQIGTALPDFSDPAVSAALEPTEPEIADSLETGIKKTFGGGVATLAANLYYVEYTDAQRTFNVSFPNGGQETLFFNAAEMTVWGVEAEGAWAVTDRLQINYNLAYMDATFDKFEADTDFDGVIDTDLSGQPVTRAPEWMGSVEGIFDHGLTTNSRMEWRLRVSYEDDSVSSYSDVSPAFNTLLESRTLVDASITVLDSDGRWYARLLGSNLTDERYRTGSLSVGATWIMSAYGAPRYYGLEVGARFGGR